jgi:hypothetical protein
MSNQREDLTFRWGLDADAFRRQLTRINADVEKSTDGIKGRLAEAFTVSAAAAGIAMLGEKMLELRRKAEDLGVSIEFLQSFERMAVKFGGSAETAGNAIQKLAEKIGMARTEGGAAEASFKQFGIELYETNGTAKSTEAIVKAIADAYKGSADAATKAALALEFFGRSGRDINNILGEGARGIDDYTAKMRALGLVASSADVKLLAEAFEDAKVSAGGLLTTVGALLYKLTTFPFQFSAAMSAGATPLQAAKQAIDYLMGRDGGGGGEAGTRAQDTAMRNRKNAEEIAKLMTARVGLASETLSDEQKLAAATEQQREIRQRMNGVAQGTVEFVKLENELISKGNEMERIKLNIQRDQTLESQKQFDLDERRRKILQEVAEKRAGKLFLSREELRGINLETVNPKMRAQFERQQKTEGQISALERLSEAHRLAGNFEYSRRLNLYIERLLLQLSLVKEEQRDPFMAQRRAMEELGGGGAPVPPGMIAPGVAVQNQIARQMAGQPVPPQTISLLSEVTEIKRMLKVGEAQFKPLLAR